MKIFELNNEIEKSTEKIINLKSINTILEFESRGKEVKMLQQALQSVGITPGPIDGKFGRQTKAATIVFQNSVQIEPDGIAGPETLGQLQAVLDGKRKLTVTTKSKAPEVKVKNLPNPNNAKEIFEKFKDAGFNDVQSAAWVGCISGESSNNPNAVGSEMNKRTGEKYYSYGLCQWNKGRFKNLQKFAKSKTGNSDGWKSNIDLQVDYVLWELDNWDKVMGASSVDPSNAIKPHEADLEKTLYKLIAHFEKPADNQSAFRQRLPYAKAALDHFGTTDLT